MPKQKTPEVSFETAITELEAVVTRLESGELPLDKALAEFEKGVELAKIGQQQLNDAQQRVQILLNDSKDEPLTPFNSGNE